MGNSISAMRTKIYFWVVATGFYITQTMVQVLNKVVPSNSGLRPISAGPIHLRVVVSDSAKFNFQCPNPDSVHSGEIEDYKLIIANDDSLAPIPYVIPSPGLGSGTQGVHNFVRVMYSFLMQVITTLQNGIGIFPEVNPQKIQFLTHVFFIQTQALIL